MSAGLLSNTNEQTNDSFNISPCLRDPRCVSKLRVFLWFDCVRVCIHAYLVVFPPIYEASCMCVHCRRFNRLAHTHTYTSGKEKKTN